MAMPMPQRTAPEAQAPKSEEKVGDVFTSLGNYIKFYGSLRLDIAYDTSRTNYGNWVLYVLPNKPYGQLRVGDNGRRYIEPIVNYNNNNEIAINPRGSRLGLDIKGTPIETIKAKIGGKVEIDFYGGDFESKEWKAVPRWRKAYLYLDWGWFELRAGQDQDVVSPLVPRSSDTGASWLLGNLGGRRPQAIFTFKPLFDDTHRLWAQVSLARPGDVDGADNDMIDRNRDSVFQIASERGDGVQDGEDSGVPMIQWRLAYEAPLWYKEMPFSVGLSGHWEQYEFRRRLWIAQLQNYSTSVYRLDSYSLNLEAQFPILEKPKWTVRGEFFWGRALADLWGGIFQGVNPESLLWLGKPEGVEAYGWWVDTTIQPFDFWALTVGYMMDIPDEGTLPAYDLNLISQTRFRNQAGFVNTEFFLGSGFMAGFQFMHVMTDYKYVLDTTTNPIVAYQYQAMDERFLLTAMYSF
ncbi:MAG: hypothetical protein C4523_19070 [Myxococcales bacterium]|nr:MAG: hypothetical protein C4523_19070 [Myxococcales bacterium]